MKKIITTIVLILSLLAVAQAQRFIGFVSAGANFSQVEGDDVHGFYKVGVNAGPGVMLHLDRKQRMSISAELLFSQKGSRCSFNHKPFMLNNYHPSMFEDVNWAIPYDSTIKCRMSLDYIQIPVIFRYEDMRSGCFIGAGFAWSRLVRAKEIYNGFTRTTSVTSGTFKTSDWTFLVDAGVRLYKNLTLNVRWEYSMVPIRYMHYNLVTQKAVDEYQIHPHNIFMPKDSWIGKMRNHVLTCRLTYFINEKFIRNTNTKNDGSLNGTKWVREIQTYE